MASMSARADDLGKRIVAARAYAGINLEGLADSISVSTTALQRVEAGLEEYGESERWALIRAIALATRLPEQFFTADFAALKGDESPEQKLDRLERKIDQALARMDDVVQEAENQMTRGKEQLDRFVESMGGDRDLLQRIAARLDIKSE
jgi:transcriptional regulator with XRE-family HTH domain